MEPFPFERLPVELKIKIIRFAIPSVIAPIGMPDGGRHILQDDTELRRIRDSCPEIKAICNRIRFLVACSHGKELFRLDPLRDTFVVNQPNSPAFRVPQKAQKQGTESFQQEGLLIRRIFCRLSGPLLSRGAPVLQTGKVLPKNGEQTYAQMPFKDSLPIWCRDSMLKAFTLALDTCDRSWHIEGFQQYGPNDIGWRTPNLWGIPGGEALEQHYGMDIVDSPRRRCDTGRPWISTGLFDHIHDPRDIVRVSYWRDKPVIGFHGYSQGDISQGGNWAGFRYWNETNKIEFRPLSWSEVRPCMEDYERISLRRSHPNFIARLWINRPGEPVDAEQSQYGWIEVKPPEAGDAPWVEQVATTWKMVRASLLGVSRDMNIEWRSENKSETESQSLLLSTKTGNMKE